MTRHRIGLLAALLAATGAFGGIGVRSARADVLTVAYGIHVVRPGETLFTLAARYGMRVADLAGINAMPRDGVLLPGRDLRVPLDRARNARADAPAVVPEGAGEVAGAGDADERDAQSASAPPTADPPGGDTRSIVVAPGDTLSGLAAAHGVAMADLQRWNGLPLDGTIYAGQTLILEGGAAPDPAPVALPSGHDVATTQTVTVQPGDTLTAIAERAGTTAYALARLNRVEGETIYAGQVLEVPRGGAGFGAGGSVGKHIEVDLSEQRMYVWEGQVLVHNWTVSTGLATHPTQTGSFAVQSKVPTAWSSAWELWMPSWLGIYWAGGSENGIHALPIVNDGTQLWAGFLGSPISYGCVVLGTSEAAQLYEWAEIGTPVVIRD